jgi:uncharacterized membrane protein
MQTASAERLIGRQNASESEHPMSDHGRRGFTAPRIGDHVEIRTPGRIVEMRLYAGVAGAVVELDPAVSGFAHDHPDGVPLARVWLPLDALVVIPSGTP